MGLFEKLKSFVNMEIKDESEPKETAVLVRVLCLLDIAFIIFDTFFMFSGYPYRFGIFTLIILLVLSSDLFFSYKLGMHSLIGIYYITSLVASVYFTICTGIIPMFHIQSFIVFLLYFYRSKETALSRLCSVILSGAAGIVALFYVIVNGSILAVSIRDSGILMGMNTIHIIAKLTIFAYFFMIKFSASETKIMQYSKKLEMIATTDPLTKLQNRRGMFNHLESYLKEKPDESLTLVLGDIDFFKKINDTYGHDAGDYVLETLAKIMKEYMNGKGMVARWGGEEFLFSFEGINGDFAFEYMNVLLHMIERYEFSYNDIDFKVTMTFGVEEYDQRDNIEKTVSSADEKLYMGKEAGRDRVIF